MSDHSKGMLTVATFAAIFGLAGAASAEKLMLYTSQPDADAAATVAAFQAENPGIEVEVFRSGTSDLLGKLAAEFAAGSPQPDVLLIADALSMEGLKADNRLMAYPDANTDGFDPNAIDADKYYFGSKLITTGIAYNTAASQAPTSWMDLTGPDYKDLVVMPSPLYSGAAAFMLSAYAERDDMGWEYFEKMQENGLLAVRGNGAVLKSVATGEKAYGILVDFLAMNAIRDGSPIKFVFPKEGVTAVTEPVAIMATARNVDGAKTFIDFILSDAGQKLALSQGYLPAKAGVGKPEWLQDGVVVKVMDVDIGNVVSKVEENKQKFSTLFGG
jgi:iron(III) transport system substrate-binding protein